jgi:subtilase family serine protease
MSCTSLARLFFTSAIFAVGLAGVGVPAASAAVQDRITAEVSNSNPVAIPESVHPLALSATDLGPAPADTKLGLSIRFNMSAAQEAALDQLLADQQNPSSPRYRQWLTPAQFAAQFGLSTADIAKVTAWLTSQGFTVTGVANGGTFVNFTGTAAQAQAAFGTSIRSLSVNGEMHFANVTDVQLPDAFVGVVAAVTGLHDFRFKPRVHASVVRPEFTSSQTGNHFLAPGDVYTIYGVSTGANPLAASANGTGETIAVVGQVDIFTSDVLQFRSAAGLNTANLPTTIHAYGSDPGIACTLTNQNNCYPQPNEGDLDESSIDVEWSGAMAPSATIDFVNDINVLPGPTGTDAMTYTIDNNLAPIVTTSYGNCEAAWGSTELIALNALFKQANSQGQTVLAAAGDSGATDCDSAAYPYTNEAIEGDAVDFPGSSPYVTSMGGTQFSGDAEATGSGSTWATTQYWAGTSGSDVVSSALGYIPEAVWNDVTGGYADFGGGGGGPSAFFTKPAWQVGTPSDASRDVPDIALNASDAHDPFLYCVNVAAANGSQSCTSGFRISGGGLTVAGGTSFDSQVFGGMLALIEQKLGSRLGNINPTLYALGNSTYKSAVFNDVTTGTNAMPCIAGTPNCGNGGSTGFSAAAGYDLATGWGSVNVSNLAADWTKVTALGSGSLGANTSVTTLTALPSSVANGATVTLTATVTGSAVTPTGNVQFLANNAALGSPVAVVALNSTTATATYSWVTSCSNLGQAVVQASYSGDVNYQGSKGPALASAEAGYTGGAGTSSNGSVVVTPIEVQVSNGSCPDFSVTPSGAGVTVSGNNASLIVAAGGTIPPVTIAAAPINGFTGTVSFSATATSTTGYSPTLTFSPTSVIVPSTAESTTLTLSGITADLRIPAAPGKFDPATTVAQRSLGRSPAARQSWYAAGSGVAIASMLLLTVPRRRRRLGGLLLVALAIALVGGATGCGGSSQSGPPSGNTNPYAGNYYVNVVATYTSGSTVATHSFEVTYVIN